MGLDATSSMAFCLCGALLALRRSAPRRQLPRRPLPLQKLKIRWK